MSFCITKSTVWLLACLVKLTNNIFWVDIFQHGSISKDDISVEAGTIDELPQKESAAPTLEKVIY